MADAAKVQPEDDLARFLEGENQVRPPASKPAAPAPATPAPESPSQAPVEPVLDATLLAIAASMGFARDEAEAFGSSRALAAGINAVARRLRSSPVSASGGQTEGRPTAAPQSLPAPEPVWEEPDPAAIEAEQLHPELVRMAKGMKALKSMNDKLLKRLEEQSQYLPALVQDMQVRQNERGNQLVAAVAKDLNIDAAILREPATAQKIVRRYQALEAAMAQDGEVVDAASLLKQIIPTVINMRSTAPAPEPAVPTQPAPKRFEQPPPFSGRPTGRAQAAAPANGNALRDLLIDKGVDPGPESTHTRDVEDVMKSLLPG